MAVNEEIRYDGGTDPITAARKTCEWIESDEGRSAIRKVLEQGTPFANKLKQARKIDPESIRKPMGF